LSGKGEKMAHLIGQAISGLIQLFLLIFHWSGGFIKKYNDKVFVWAYKKYEWEKEDGDEEPE
jgi:hypothetical protein